MSSNSIFKKYILIKINKHIQHFIEIFNDIKVKITYSVNLAKSNVEDAKQAVLKHKLQ